MSPEQPLFLHFFFSPFHPIFPQPIVWFPLFFSTRGVEWRAPASCMPHPSPWALALCEVGAFSRFPCPAPKEGCHITQEGFSLSWSSYIIIAQVSVCTPFESMTCPRARACVCTQRIGMEKRQSEGQGSQPSSILSQAPLPQHTYTHMPTPHKPNVLCRVTIRHSYHFGTGRLPSLRRSRHSGQYHDPLGFSVRPTHSK